MVCSIKYFSFVFNFDFQGWWFVKNGDRTGFVPGAFLTPNNQQQDNQEMNTSKISSSTWKDTFTIKMILCIDETYLVNQSYEAKNRDEISLNQGSFVTVLEKSYTGWWMVQ